MTDGGRDNIIPLPTVEAKAVPQEQREAMRAAVLQVITDLVVERVSPSERSPLFDTAKDLLAEAGRSPVEMLEAAEPGRAQDDLLEELGLQGGGDE